MPDESHPPATIFGPLPFTHSKRGVAETLRGFASNAAWLVGLARENAPTYTVDWRKRHNLIQIKPPEDTPQDRGDWFRSILGRSLAYGMDLPTSSEPVPEELAWAVARWAHGALLHIQHLEQAHQRAISEWAVSDLRQQQEYETLLKVVEARDAEIKQRQDQLAVALRREADITERLGQLHDDVKAARERDERSMVLLRAEIDALVQEVKRADSERDAWRVAAQASGAALDTLRAALRIPVGPSAAPAPDASYDATVRTGATQVAPCDPAAEQDRCLSEYVGIAWEGQAPSDVAMVRR